MAWRTWKILPFVLLLSITPIQSKNIGPSIQVSSSFEFDQERSGAPQVPADHVFFANYQKNFSWHDDALLERLWHGRRPNDTEKKALAKRAPTTVVGDAVFKLPSCLGCMRAALLDQTASLDSLTRVFLQQQILIPTAQLQSRCVFYTGVQDHSDYLKRLALLGTASGTFEHPNLSKLATDWACSSNKVTIWNLYSGSNTVSGAAENTNQYNFWEVYVEGSWLNPLLDQPPNPPNAQFTYFGRMSNAMAQVCGGTIYVASLDPTNLQKYGFIWANDEYPTLKARWQAGGFGAPTSLISVDMANPQTQYVVSFNDLSTQYQVPPTKRDEMWGEGEGLQKRDNCDANVAYEPSTEDWFGVGGKIGPLGYGLGN